MSKEDVALVGNAISSFDILGLSQSEYLKFIHATYPCSFAAGPLLTGGIRCLSVLVKNNLKFTRGIPDDPL